MFSAELDSMRFKAIVFDVDGTLYQQGPVRHALLFRLVWAHVYRPRQGLETLRTLRAYREAQERLRLQAPNVGDIAQQQVQLASDWTGIPPALVRSYVTRWMEQEPLDLLGTCRRDGLLELLSLAAERGLRLAACSDYPAIKKLAAMGIASFFDVVVHAQDVEVQRFKPDPRVLQVALRRLGVHEEEALYVGDRPEVDAEAARRAGVACAIIARRYHPHPTPGCLYLTSLRQLVDFIR